MWTENTGVVGVGYEGADATTFLAGLISWEIGILVDVRLHPISRKKGFSKRALAEMLEGECIDYLHLPALGNPKDNRDGFARLGSEAALLAHGRYQELLLNDEAQDALERLTDLARQRRVAVLCFEASDRCCHRQFVLDNVKRKLGNRIPI